MTPHLTDDEHADFFSLLYFFVVLFDDFSLDFLNFVISVELLQQR